MSSINHVAIIMDGNGRWARERRHPRVWGHVRGSLIVGDIVEAAVHSNLRALTLYAFSTENWRRPKSEIQTLFKLIKKFLLRERENILKNNIQFKIIGDIGSLATETQTLIRDIERASADNTGLLLSFAFNYGGRKEIVDAANCFFAENPGMELTEESLNSYLYRPSAGDVDLLIRTAGDKRISNFLLWQASYAELYFSQTKWPDFTPLEFRQILDQVSKRERRFGAVPRNAADELSFHHNVKAVSHGS